MPRLHSPTLPLALALLAPLFVVFAGGRAGGSPACAPSAGGAVDPQGVSSPEDPPGPAERVQGLAEELRALREGLELDARQSVPRLDEPGRRVAGEALDAAEAALDEAVRAAARAAELELAAREAPARLLALREELSRPLPGPRAEVPDGVGLAQVELLRQQAEAELAARRAALEELALEGARRLEALVAIPEQLSRLRRELEELSDALAAAGPAPAGLLEQARRLRLAAERQRLAARIAELASELESYHARAELLPARQSRAQRRLLEAERLAGEWRRTLDELRREEAERASEQARASLAAAAELAPLRRFAQENERLAALRTAAGPGGGTLARIELAREELEEARRSLAQRRARFASLRWKLEEVGLIPSMARLLGEEYEKLGDLRRLEAALRARRARLSDAQLDALLLREQLAELGVDHEEAAALLAELPPAASPGEETPREALALELVQARHGLVARLAADHEALYETLAALERHTRELVGVTAAYRAYIEEHILWVRSVKDVVPRPGATLAAAAFLLDPLAWQAAVRATLEELPRAGPRALGLLLALLVLGALSGLRPRMVAALRASGGLVARYSTDSYAHTLRAVALTLGLSLAPPLLVWTIGWVLSWPHDQRPVAVAVAAGLRSAAWLLLPLHAFSQIVRRDGLAQDHFRWPERAVGSLRRHLRWLLAALYPIVTLVWALRAAEPEHSSSLGRIVFLAGVFLVAVFARRVLRPAGPVLATYYEQNAEGWPARLARAWLSLGVGVPLALAVAAGAGYYYTALRLAAPFAWSVGLLVAVVVVHAMLLRWLYVERRRLAVRQAEKRRAEALAARGAGEAGLEGQAPLPEAELDLPAISAQTRQLFRSLLALALLLGLYMVWAGVLPALRVLDRVQVWPRIQVLEPEGRGTARPAELEPARAAGELPLLAGAPRGRGAGSRLSVAAPDEPPPPAGAGITLADLGVALIVLLITLAAARNAPGLLEITIFRRIHMDPGTRYATQTIARYAILIVGISSTFGAIGVGWREVQWLAAALTFGLAFGLQEIFANWVSGLIILFEQPVRVGDTVTVGEVDGRVTRISMRATTVTDWNRKELVIPNKEFITRQFVNWTLSDSVTRMVVPVGVAYGSDTRQVRELLEQAARSVPYVLEKPPPVVIFKRFGDSALDFELRLFVDGMEHWSEVLSAVHTAIDDAFRAAGIEIAFPQLDLHLRSATPLRIEDADAPGP